jgi:acetyl-CoA acetyltransferase
VFTQNPDLWTIPGAAEASQRALAQAGITAGDVDFAELYDCFTISELLQIEDIGFCGKGEGGAFVEAGHTRLDGSIPINTHGGLLSYSYLLGVEHVVEAVRQLRHEAGANQVPNAEVGLVSGLTVPEFGVLVLGA